MSTPKIIELNDVEKWYGKIRATGPNRFEVHEGEFVSLLGPSGCGKTTVLRLISGLTEPTSGLILMDGKVVNDVPTHKRGIGMVFQSYALFPHLTVFENVGFGLGIRKYGKREIQKKTNDILDLVQLRDVSDRYPHELSGGQQQRVALARSLVTNPRILLLDEPLSNLDLKLREQMRLELISIHKSLKITTIYVTHDQGEALAMSDRIVIMHEGLIKQVGKPSEIYWHPKGRFVADFIGQSNFLEGRSYWEKGRLFFVTNRGLKLRIRQEEGLPDSKKLLLIRPEIVILASDLSGDNVFDARVEETVYQGDITRYHLLVGEKERLIVSKQSERTGIQFTPGICAKCQIKPEDCFLIEG